MLLRFWAFCALFAGGATCLPGTVLYSVTDLGSLGGNYTFASGINNAGQIAGTSYTASFVQHAFLYSNGVMTDIGTLPGGATSLGSAINNAEQMEGSN